MIDTNCVIMSEDIMDWIDNTGAKTAPVFIKKLFTSECLFRHISNCCIHYVD